MNLVKIRSYQQPEMAALRAAHGHKAGVKKSVLKTVRHASVRRVSANLTIRRRWFSKVWTWENN